MDNVSECVAEKDKCSCETEPTLAVLRDVHRAYEDKMELISRSQAPDKLEKQVQLLQSWVGDLVAQNTLLARTVEELESELTNKIHSERRKFTEMASELGAEVWLLREMLSRKDSDLRGLLELIRRLREYDHYTIEGIHFNEVTQSDIFGHVVWLVLVLYQVLLIFSNDLFENRIRIGRIQSSRTLLLSLFISLLFQERHKKICNKINELKINIDSLQKENLTKESNLSFCKCHKPNVSKKDAQVMTDIYCAGSTTEQRGDEEPLKEFSASLRNDRSEYQESIQHNIERGERARRARGERDAAEGDPRAAPGVRSAGRAVQGGSAASTVQGRDHSRDAAAAAPGQG
ncbi:unnamed protein product [Leptidea sinapis]|uniref:Uncharacterized protein n=1 Tax=Leptidea sinapis TaxID=189913 RepID=A0A5E4PW05_9NEOP|nr:unnamed protein product [Leptidea sinapis]